MSLNFMFPLTVLMADLLVISLLGLAAAGHFPDEHRRPALRGKFGSAVLFGSVTVTCMCLVVAILFAWARIPWYAAIIGCGASVLAAPLLLQLFRDRFVDGIAALLTFSGAAVVLTFILVWIEQ
jgi:hypothetical protein